MSAPKNFNRHNSASVHASLEDAQLAIDSVFGPLFAKAHPELVGAFINAVALESSLPADCHLESEDCAECVEAEKAALDS